MQPPVHIREINKARDWYNPLRGLTIQRAALLLEHGERGRYSDLQKLNRMAEKRFSVLRALKHRILGGLQELDWTIRIVSELPAGFSKTQAEAQQTVLRERYDAIENLPEAIGHLALAEFRGYAHLEPRYPEDDPSQPANRLNPVPQWHWFRDNETWAWRYDPTARDQIAASTLIDEADFIIREIDDPIDEIALLCFIRANDSVKNWDAFRDDYAIPMLFAMLGENTPIDKVKEWLDLMKEATKNSRGALPPGSKVESPDIGNPDGEQFSKHVAFMREEVVLAGTSGLLTMLTAPGSGTLAGSAHQEAMDLIISALGAKCAATLQAQHDKRILKLEFPSQPALAYFSLESGEPDNRDAEAKQLANLKLAGFQADPEEVSEKFGYTFTIAAPPAAAGPGAEAGGADPLKNRLPGIDARRVVFDRNSERLLSQADAAAVAPLLDRLAELPKVPDAGLIAWLEQFWADVPRLLAEARLKSPDIAGIWDHILSAALADGLSQRPEPPAKP